MKLFNSLCKPAQFYLVISVAAFAIVVIQNLGATKTFTLGAYSCDHGMPWLILLLNALYILIWTWMLNVICKINPKISWVIVLFPFVLLFLALGILVLKPA
jgi:hypothetical protein